MKARVAISGLALLTFIAFLLTGFRAGWTRAETDFPNYYTAAVLVRHRQPLRNFYDWTWFERQMNYAGMERQLGAYSPQTPLTMLPIVPLAGLPVQRAKQIWLLCNLAFLGVTVLLLSRVSKFRPEQIWLLVFCGYHSLYNNFLFGQYYVFLLFLLTATLYLLDRRLESASGFVAGLTFGLKLYGGPLFIFFLIKRKWKAAAAMLAAMILCGIVAIKLFGWPDIHYYLTNVLVRSLDANSGDPYSTGASTVSNMLRHLFLREPELNPHPLWNSPPLFFLLHTFVSLAIAAVLILASVLKPASDRRDFAWFVVATLLLSTNSASYVFIVLLLPLVLLLEESEGWETVFFILSYFILTLPVHLARLFPKLWLLCFVFVVIRRDYWRELRRPAALVGTAFLVFVASANMKLRMAQFAKEPGQKFEMIGVTPRAFFSSYPVVTRAGIFYQFMGDDRYILRRIHDGRNDELEFDGQALRPMARSAGGPIYFELVAHGTSTMMQFEPINGKAVPTSLPVSTKDLGSAVSPDGKWLAFTSDETGTKQIWIKNLATGNEQALTAGFCDNSLPTWELDSQAIIFSSDCERALGLPALYRAPVP